MLHKVTVAINNHQLTVVDDIHELAEASRKASFHTLALSEESLEEYRKL